MKKLFIDNNINQQKRGTIFSGFFNFYLAAPWLTLGHSQGDSLTNSMLSTAFFIHFDLKVTGSFVTRLGL